MARSSLVGATMMVGVALVVMCIIGSVVDASDDNLVYNLEEKLRFQDLFLSYPQAANVINYLHNLTSKTHLAGTPGGYDHAVYIHDQWKQFGIDNVEIQPFDSLLTYPIHRSIEIVQPVENAISLNMTEVPIEGDPTSFESNVPTFNGYAGNGSVTAELIYANYGRLEDFNYLESLNISVANKIVLVRYGQIFRGTKVMIAQQRGALGVIIYSDPADDGYVMGKVYPEGPWRPESSVQRGSVQFISICPGDPRRVSECLTDSDEEMIGNLIPNIPVQPISYGDASYLFKSMESSPNAIVLKKSSGWKGGLNVNYVIGNNLNTIVNLTIETNYTVAPLYNVIATIPGAVYPDRSVLIGNHHDAWVFGATDPSIGTSLILEIGRAFGLLLKQGWQPDRTIILCAWDAEEYALIGSTHYAEKNADSLQNGAVAYFNVDMSSGATFSASGTPSLSAMLRQVASKVPYGNKNQTLGDKWNGEVSALGSGSDYTAFIDHLGIASMDMRVTGPYGVYHSNYDSYTWYRNVSSDPDLVFATTLAKTVGLAALTVADSYFLPFDYLEYGQTLLEYINTTKASAQAANMSLDFDSLTKAVNSLIESSYSLQTEINETMTSANYSYTKTVAALNDKLMSAERYFLISEGFKSQGRPWYKHCVQAPGLYKGYAPDVFPGVASAIENNNEKDAKSQVSIASSHIDNVAVHLSSRKTNILVWLIAIVISVVVVIGVLFFIHKRRQQQRIEVV